MAHRWIVEALIVITVGARGTTHTPSIKLLQTKLKLPEITLKHTLTPLPSNILVLSSFIKEK